MAKYSVTLHVWHIDADEVPTKEELQEYADNIAKEWTSYNPNEAGWDKVHVKVTARKAEDFNPLKDKVVEVTASAECKENEWHTSKDSQ